MARWLHAWQNLLLGCVQLAALLAFAPITGLPLDDAWIHQVVARTFAESGTLGYAPGAHGAAATSQLWAALLALDYRVFHLGPARFAFLLNALAALAAGQLLYALLVRVVPRGFTKPTWRIVALFATTLACVSGNVVWLAHSGMEACLFVALSLAAIWAATRTNGGLLASLLAGIAAGLLALTRPEAIPLGALVVFFALWRGRPKQEIASMLVPWVACTMLYLGANLAHTGAAFPATRAGRTWLWLSGSTGLGPIDLAIGFAETWASRLHRWTFATRGFGLWIAIGFAAYGAIRLLRLKNDGIRLLLAWAAIHVAFYAAVLPTPGHGGRYQPFVPLLFALAVAMGTSLAMVDVARRIDVGFPFMRRLPTWAWLGAVPWALVAQPAWRNMQAAHVAAIAHVERTEIGMGAFIASLPPDAVVASFDIGGIGFASRRAILDIGGLSDATTAEYLRTGRASEVLRAHAVTHVVLPGSRSPQPGEALDFATRLHLAENPNVVLEPMHMIETPRGEWHAAVEATWNAAQRQVLFTVQTTEGNVVPPARTAVRPRTIADPHELVPERDRIVADHMLSVLASWGVDVDVQVSHKQHEPSGAHCTIVVGPWGSVARGCRDDAALSTTLAPYTGSHDLGGAMKVLPHALARQERKIDPTFQPVLATTNAPVRGGSKSIVDKTFRWGLPLALFVFFTACWVRVLARTSRIRHNRAASWMRTERHSPQPQG
jgi:hypothetical protein